MDSNDVSADRQQFTEYLGVVLAVLDPCLSAMTERESREPTPHVIVSEERRAAQRVKVLAVEDSYFEIETKGFTWRVAFDVVFGKSQSLDPLSKWLAVESFLKAAKVGKGDAQFAGIVGNCSYVELHASALPYPHHTWYLRMRAYKAVR